MMGMTMTQKDLGRPRGSRAAVKVPEQLIEAKLDLCAGQ